LKKTVIYFILLWGLNSFSQQSQDYIQYIFNKAVNNPAASGTSAGQKFNYTFGATRQWYDITGAPKQTFVNTSFTIRSPRSYSYWQNVGITIINDQAGLLTNNSYYANYTIHLVLAHNLVASFGVHAGFRKFFMSQGIIDPKDPVMAKVYTSAYAYPDLIPGFRLSNRKFFFDISARQVSVYKQGDYFGPKAIAGGSFLRPGLFMAYGYVVGISDHLIALPSCAVNWNWLGVPAFNPTLMFYYDNRFGFGIASRNITFAAAIFQVRMFKNLTMGLSYAYTTNRARLAVPNTYEIMVGIAPMGISDKQRGRHSAAKCPALDF
jgi:type IX secretion system PorP/SprF family membrane protein